MKLRAREMRYKPTPAEATLWQQLRNKRLDGLAFRRQHTIGQYIVDFYCPPARLIIEVDGSIHDLTVDADLERQRNLESQDYRVLRFTNTQVLQDIGAVLQNIRAAVHQEMDRIAGRKAPVQHER